MKLFRLIGYLILASIILPQWHKAAIALGRWGIPGDEVWHGLTALGLEAVLAYVVYQLAESVIHNLYNDDKRPTRWLWRGTLYLGFVSAVANALYYAGQDAVQTLRGEPVVWYGLAVFWGIVTPILAAATALFVGMAEHEHAKHQQIQDAKSALRAANEAYKDAIPDCPYCNAPFRTVDAYTKHLAKCSLRDSPLVDHEVQTKSVVSPSVDHEVHLVRLVRSFVDQPGLTFGERSGALGVPQTTVKRWTKDAVSTGYLSQDAPRAPYHVTELGIAFAANGTGAKQREELEND